MKDRVARAPPHSYEQSLFEEGRMEGVTALDPGHQLPHVRLASFLSSSWHPTPLPQTAHLLPKKRYKAGSTLHGVR